ncbi:MAG: hypothetical protein H6864_09860 [Micavibrio sp.]|nr:hypothetical protein [Micavibrio sp.]
MGIFVSKSDKSVCIFHKSFAIFAAISMIGGIGFVGAAEATTCSYNTDGVAVISSSCSTLTSLSTVTHSESNPDLVLNNGKTVKYNKYVAAALEKSNKLVGHQEVDEVYYPADGVSGVTLPTLASSPTVLPPVSNPDLVLNNGKTVKYNKYVAAALEKSNKLAAPKQPMFSPGLVAAHSPVISNSNVDSLHYDLDKLLSAQAMQNQAYTAQYAALKEKIVGSKYGLASGKCTVDGLSGSKCPTVSDLAALVKSQEKAKVALQSQITTVQSKLSNYTTLATAPTPIVNSAVNELKTAANKQLSNLKQAEPKAANSLTGSVFCKKSSYISELGATACGRIDLDKIDINAVLAKSYSDSYKK